MWNCYFSQTEDPGPLALFLGFGDSPFHIGDPFLPLQLYLATLDKHLLHFAKHQQLSIEPSAQFNEVDGKALHEPSLYRNLIGRLMYLTLLCLNIIIVVNHLIQFTTKPHTPHIHVIHHLLQYLRGASSQGILFPSCSSLPVTVYSDAYWGS